jgi:hypothetical protein
MEIGLADNQPSEKSREAREALPFWARELLAMKDEAEKKPNVHKLECVK